MRAAPFHTAIAATLALVACTPGGGEEETELPPLPAAAAGVSTVERPDEILGSAPGGCLGPATEARRVLPQFERMVGGAPLWAGFEGLVDVERRVVYVPRNSPLTTAGWELEVVWALEPAAKGPVEISGRQRGGDELSVRFGFLDDVESATSLRLDPRRAQRGPDGYRVFASRVYIPRGDCFSFQARLGDGSRWRIVLGLGL